MMQQPWLKPRRFSFRVGKNGEILVGGQNLRETLVRAGVKREKDNKDKCGPLGITRSRGIIFSRKIPDKIGGNT